MTYDQWKLRSPDDERYDYDDEIEDGCDCVEYETDSESYRSCSQCGRRWYPTREEVETEQRLQREYDAWERQQRRREFWRKVVKWLWPRKASKIQVGDEVPF